MLLTALVMAGLGTPLSAQTITGLTPTGYQVARLVEGSAYYVDRTYTLAGIPPNLVSAQFVMAFNNDKNFTGSVHIQFTVDMPVKVFIAYDSRATARPAWMAGWAPNGETLGTTDVPLTVFRRDFGTAGAITLGGNLQSPADAQTHYVAAVQPLTVPALAWPTPGVAVAFTREPGLLLTWQDLSDNEAAFEVERAAPGGAFALLINLPANTATYRDLAVTPGQTWCYRVRASNSAGASGFTNEACGTAR